MCEIQIEMKARKNQNGIGNTVQTLRQTIRDPQNQFLLSDVLPIRIYLIYVHYYSKPNNAQKLVCVKQKFVLRVFVLTRFYCSVKMEEDKEI